MNHTNIMNLIPGEADKLGRNLWPPHSSYPLLQLRIHFFSKKSIWANVFWAMWVSLASDLCLSLRVSSTFGHEACQAGTLWVPLIPAPDPPAAEPFRPSTALSGLEVSWGRNLQRISVTPAVISYVPFVSVVWR